VLIGTIGLAAEWGWTQVWFVHPWTASMFPEALLLALAMAVAAGTVGGFVGRALTLRGTRLAAVPYWTLPAAAVLALVVGFLAIPISAGDGRTRATLRLTAAPPVGGDRGVEETGPGEFRTTEPAPVDGTWKTILRLHRDDEVLGLPVYLPEDPAIPAKEVPATSTIDRAFVLDKKNLQRE
jgi:hypothetical protein